MIHKIMGEWIRQKRRNDKEINKEMGISTWRIDEIRRYAPEESEPRIGDMSLERIKVIRERRKRRR